jgi:hypothetical protein
MVDSFLVPPNTTVEAKGEGSALEISGTQHRAFLLTLSITKIVEQEALEIGIFGSADGATWTPKAMATFPQKFYCGDYPFLLDLSEHPDVRFLRARWDPSRWGRGPEQPMFTFSLTIREIPPEVLSEARNAARARV